MYISLDSKYNVMGVGSVHKVPRELRDGERTSWARGSEGPGREACFEGSCEGQSIDGWRGRREGEDVQAQGGR